MPHLLSKHEQRGGVYFFYTFVTLQIWTFNNFLISRAYVQYCNCATELLRRFNAAPFSIASPKPAIDVI